MQTFGENVEFVGIKFANISKNKVLANNSEFTVPDAAYQLSRSSAFWFQSRRVFHVFTI